MFLAVDIGNTNITIGLIEDNEVQMVVRLSSNTVKTKDQYVDDFYGVINHKNIDKDKIEGAVISSVVPSITLKLVHAIEYCFNVSPIVVNCNMDVGIEFNIDEKSTIGADLIAGCVGAVNFLQGPLIVVDLGTATTLMVIDSDKKVQGGCIIPGIKIALESMCQKAALLSEINLDEPREIIGKNTVDCIKSGSIYGTVAMLEGLCDAIEDSLGYDCNVIITGGLTPLVEKYFKRKVHIKPNLLLEGLSYIYNLMQENALPVK